MTHETFINQAQVKVPTEKLDLFIDRCCNEKDETLYTLQQALNFKLHRCFHSAPEGDILPFVIARLAERIKKGDK